ncbi:hypothetical protein V4D30_01850 [Thermodesulfovibrio sp. 3907-1M]|uniref:DUF3313 domain-containing protein n=1 Tax=Thermodesulfovibrio autotrophicus TaxID=3118333 RepID=A0AAU8GYF0_9BACT
MRNIFLYFKLYIFCFLCLIYGCSPLTTKVEWETGRVINPQFAEKVVIVDKFQFKANLKRGLTTEAVVTGDISDCLVKSLRNNLIGYAVLKDEEVKNTSPNATIIRITPTKVSTDYNFWGTKILGEVYVKVQANNTVTELEGEGKAKAEMSKACFIGNLKFPCAFEVAFSEACDDVALKLDKLLNKFTKD